MIFEDPEIAEALSELGELDQEIGGLKEQASLVSQVNQISHTNEVDQ